MKKEKTAVEKRKSVEAELGVKSSRLCENVTPCAEEKNLNSNRRDSEGAIATKNLTFKHASLFSGIGGFDLAAEWMGWENVFQVEIDEWCRKILAKNFPNIKRYADIKRFDGSKYCGRVDIVTGGWPCPKYSVAGLQGGGEPLKDELIRTTKQIMPRWFLFENVPGLITPKLSIEHAGLINEMENVGYKTRSFGISAKCVGAKQVRERIWIIGRNKMGNNTNSEGGKLGEIFNEVKKKGTQNSLVVSGNPFGFHWYEAISRIHRVFDGVSRGMDKHRNRGLGNAVVPQIPLMIFKAIEQCEALTDT